mgnify:CR=1 FL=1
MGESEEVIGRGGRGEQEWRERRDSVQERVKRSK